jgi:hypothetical protein
MQARFCGWSALWQCAQAMISFVLIEIRHAFDWGCVCVLLCHGAHFQEERKLGWDRLGGPKMLRRVIDLKPGDTFEAMLLRSQAKVGDTLSLAEVEAEISLWSDWQ